MGPVGSDTWNAMLDGAEAVLRDEGHAALTSRRIAERIGVKQRLVYYYFATMDDLITELFRRLSERELERFRAARRSDRPLREIWDICIHTTDARLISEFIALANRIEELSAEVVHFIEESRRIQVDALEAALKRAPAANHASAAALAIVATSVALTLTREQKIGVDSGHDDVMALIEAFLARAEPS
ncbi:MAG: TetR/AcrR family transcriptional regulator [Novosphingobium sp.]|nr:TetR/AcrR family transcriptional regulator [Novosphingobium sp.]